MTETQSISPDTKITIGTAIAVITISISATWWFSNRLTDVERKFDAVNSRLAQLETQMPERYALASASEQSLRMAIENPGLRVPDPRDPSKIIQVLHSERGKP